MDKELANDNIDLIKNIVLYSLGLIGLITIIFFNIKLFIFIKNRFLYSNKAILLPLYGPWACITGATDGIGKEISMQLAMKGFNIVIISRDMEKLENTAKEIKEKAPASQVKIIQVDFSNFDENARKRVADELSTISSDLGVLVNNVGKSYEHPMRFHELSDNDVHGLIELNINSTTWMTRIVLPSMLERSSKKKRSSIINIGSAASLQSNPMLAQYSAAKSYIQLFSQALDAEYNSKGIEVVCHTPYFIVSKLSKVRKVSLSVPSPATYAKLVIKAIGSGVTVINPYIPHAILGFVLTSLPESIVCWAILGEHEKLRKRALEKKAGNSESKNKKIE